MPALRVASSWRAREDPRNGACRTRQLRKECVGSHQQAEAGEEPTLSWEWNPRAAPGQGQAVRRAGPGRRRPSTERHPGFQTRAPAQATGVVAELGRAQGHIPETTPTTAVRFRRHDEAGDRLRRAMMGDATTLAGWPSRGGPPGCFSGQVCQVQLSPKPWAVFFCSGHCGQLLPPYP